MLRRPRTDRPFVVSGSRPRPSARSGLWSPWAASQQRGSRHSKVRRRTRGEPFLFFLFSLLFFFVPLGLAKRSEKRSRSPFLRSPDPKRKADPYLGGGGCELLRPVCLCVPVSLEGAELLGGSPAGKVLEEWTV